MAAASAENEDQLLMDAVACDDLDAVKRLIKSNAQAVTVVDDDDLTALMVAAGCGALSSMQLLLDEGADPDDTDPAGRTALLVAAAENHPRSVAALAADEVTRVERLTASTASGNTALHRAAAYGGVGVIKTVVGLYGKSRGAGSIASIVNAANSKGRTPLIRAARWGRPKEAQELLKAGADASLADKEGKTAWTWAEAKGHTDVLDVLDAAEGTEREVEMFVVECSSFAEDLLSEIRETIKAVGDEEDYEDEGAASPSSMQDIRAKGRTFSVVGSLGGGTMDGPSRVEGWMAKKGHLFRSWRNRWFVLDDGDMSYFSKPEDRKCKGTVKLTADSSVESLVDYHRPFVFKVTTPSKAFMLQAADEDELDEWIGAVRAHITAFS